MPLDSLNSQHPADYDKKVANFLEMKKQSFVQFDQAVQQLKQILLGIDEEEIKETYYTNWTEKDIADLLADIKADSLPTDGSVISIVDTDGAFEKIFTDLGKTRD